MGKRSRRSSADSALATSLVLSESSYRYPRGLRLGVLSPPFQLSKDEWHGDEFRATIDIPRLDVSSETLELALDLAAAQSHQPLAAEPSLRAPTHRLPNEILGEIFACGVAVEWNDASVRLLVTSATSFTFATAVLCVCKRWRALARATPDVWRYQDLAAHPLANTADRDARVEHAGPCGFVAARVDVGCSYRTAPRRRFKFTVHPHFVLDLPTASLKDVVQLDLHFEPKVFDALVAARRSGRVPVIHLARLRALMLGAGRTGAPRGAAQAGGRAFVPVASVGEGEFEGLFTAPSLREFVLEDPILAWLLVVTSAGGQILDRLTIHSPPFGAGRTAAEHIIAHTPTRSLSLHIHPRTAPLAYPHPHPHPPLSVPQALQSLTITTLVGHACRDRDPSTTRALHELAYEWCTSLLRSLHRTPVPVPVPIPADAPDSPEHIVRLHSLALSAPGLPTDLSLWSTLQPHPHFTVYQTLETLHLAPFALPHRDACTGRIHIGSAFPRLRTLALASACEDPSYYYTPSFPCFEALLRALAVRVGVVRGKDDEAEYRVPAPGLRSLRLWTYCWTTAESRALARLLISRETLRADILGGRMRVLGEREESELETDTGSLAQVCAVEELAVELHTLRRGAIGKDAERCLLGKDGLQVVEGQDGRALKMSRRGDGEPLSESA